MKNEELELRITQLILMDKDKELLQKINTIKPLQLKVSNRLQSMPTIKVLSVQVNGQNLNPKVNTILQIQMKEEKLD